MWGRSLNAIEVGALNGLPKLTQLAISRTEITEIIPGTFENLSNLERLSLSYNKFQHLDSDVFSGLINLKQISFLGSKLKYLHSDTFLGLPNIKHIDLYNSRQLQIPTDRPFIASHSLSKLEISDCNISSLSVETFANVSALEWLDLKYNKLKTLDINILTALPKLSVLYVHGNRLQCDCHLQEVWRLCEDRNITTNYYSSYPQCYTPNEVYGMWWGVLEYGECTQGDIRYCGDYRNTSYSYSETTDPLSSKYNPENIIQYQLAIYAVSFIFGTTCNVIIIVIIVRNKDMRTVYNIYVINLAISDIIYLTVIFSECLANRVTDTRLYGTFICTFLSFCLRLSVGLSAYCVAVLSIQRYRATFNPLHVNVSSPPTWRVTVASICGVWIVAGLFAIPSAISYSVCANIDYIRNETYHINVVIFYLLVSCVIPLSVIGFTYITTVRHLVKRTRISEGIRIFLFLISYVPYHIIWTYIVFTKPESNNHSSVKAMIAYDDYQYHYTHLISTCFLLLNPCLNPVALFCASSKFRQHLKRYLTVFCKKNYSSNVLELANTN
jgi:hypothetical protein